ncbi:MAG: glutamate synthase subunit beta [Lachnospiraceae bacterium]|nr:glutamate synthase subunit beta [Lachnospiraceae bacterium]
MGKSTGFMEYERCEGECLLPKTRAEGFGEFHGRLSNADQQLQGARCMECGVPFCQAGAAIEGMTSGCPLHNLVPETNDLVYRGKWEQAYLRLSKTHGLPEFTARVCPALCEKACTCGLHSEPVTTRENELAIIENAFSAGLVKEEKPEVRTKKRIAIIGSGPSGLAAAQLLNRRGHNVTVFERSDKPGGLLRYGIPNMKLDKRVIDRRVKLLEEAGVEFKCGVNVGADITGKELLKTFDRVILCCGASSPRDIKAPGRDAKGIYFAVDFLGEVTKKVVDSGFDYSKVKSADNFIFGSLKGKKVVVIGGGDTGNDCVGTSIRLGASSVTQLEMMPKPPAERDAANPWPEWPKVLKTDYGQEEAIAFFGMDPRVYQTTVTEFIKNARGGLKAVRTVDLEPKKDKKTGRISMEPVSGSEKEIKTDIVLIAAGFTGSEEYLRKTFDVEADGRTNVKASDSDYATSTERVFAAGDVRRGPSLVVWAIAEGRAAARAVDQSLMGYSNL